MEATTTKLMIRHRKAEGKYFSRKYERENPYPLGQDLMTAVSHCKAATLAYAAHMEEYDRRIAGL